MKLCKIQFSILIFSCLYSANIQAKLSYYPNAYSQIESMLSEQDSIDFRKAVFLTENVYCGYGLNEKNFNATIKFYVSICKGIANSGNIVYPEKDIEKASVQCAVFLFMTDTTSVIGF